MELIEKLINRLKKYSGQSFWITFETCKGFLSHSVIECGDVYVREEIKNLDEDGAYFLDDVINIVRRDTMLSFILKDKGIKSVKDYPDIIEDAECLDKFDIEYERGIIISIVILEYYDLNEETDNYETDRDEVQTEQFNRNEYIKELLLRNYFEKDNETLINVLTTLKSLEGKNLFIEHSGNIFSYNNEIYDMVFEEVIGKDIFSDGIKLKDLNYLNGICINEKKIVGFNTFDNSLTEEANIRHEIEFEDGSVTIIKIFNDTLISGITTISSPLVTKYSAVSDFYEPNQIKKFEEQLSNYLIEYGLKEDKFIFDWSNSFAASRRTYENINLTDFSSIKVLNVNNKIIAEGWMETIHDNSEKFIIAFWEFLTFNIDGKEVSAKRECGVPKYVLNKLPLSTREKIEKYLN